MKPHVAMETRAASEQRKMDLVWVRVGVSVRVRVSVRVGVGLAAACSSCRVG